MLVKVGVFFVIVYIVLCFCGVVFDIGYVVVGEELGDIFIG